MVRIGNYILFDQIGEGGMGRIHLAYRQTGTRVEGPFAYKSLPQGSLVTPRDKEAFELEARIASKLNHPSVVRCVDVVNTPETLAIVMELIQGHSLSDFLALRYGRAPMSVGACLFLALKIAEVLKYLHNFNSMTGSVHDLIHGDLTPSNILVTDAGEIRVIDFGIARSNKESAASEMKMSFANLNYAAPNRVTRNSISPSDDVFGLGLILWELLTNRSYHAGRSPEEIYKFLHEFKVVNPRTFNPSIPTDVADFVVACLDSETLNGIATASDAVEDLRRLSQPYSEEDSRQEIVLKMEDTFGTEMSMMREKISAFADEAAAEFAKHPASVPDISQPKIQIPTPPKPVTPLRPPPAMATQSRPRKRVEDEMTVKPKLPIETVLAMIGVAVFIIVGVIVYRHHPVAIKTVIQNAGQIVKKTTAKSPDDEDDKKEADQATAGSTPTSDAAAAKPMAAQAEPTAMPEAEPTAAPSVNAVTKLFPKAKQEPPKVYTVSVMSVPQSATVVVDGQEVGKTPLDISIGARPSAVEVSKDGFPPVSLIIDKSASALKVILPKGDYEIVPREH